MSKTDGPLLSFGARGTIAKTVTFATWRGVKYARQRVIPNNPQTAAQSETRSVFTFSSDLWKLHGTIVRLPWQTLTTGRPRTARNAYIGQNVKVLRNQASLQNWIASPGANGGIPPDSTTVTSPMAGEIEVAFTTPSPPPGWTLIASQAVILQDQDPSQTLANTPVEMEATSSPYTITFTGLASAVAFSVARWLKWTNASGATAFSVSEASIITTT